MGNIPAAHAHAHGTPRFGAEADHSSARCIYAAHRPLLVQRGCYRHRLRVTHGRGEDVSVHNDSHSDQGVRVGGGRGWRRRGGGLQTKEAVLRADRALRQREKWRAGANIEPEGNVRIGCSGEGWVRDKDDK